MTYWRQAVFSYLRFSAICAQHVRVALKQEFKKPEAAKSTIKQTLWKEVKPIKAE
uniref:ATP synthase subunit epsilon, mitochondrial n=1 Tax=Parasteatoda tepidariorum TaxID=114398 RepID=A0A2L2XXC4_PARTP